MAENTLILLTLLLDYSSKATMINIPFSLPTLIVGWLYILSQAILFLGYSLWKKFKPERKIDSGACRLLGFNRRRVQTRVDNSLRRNNETELRHRLARDNTNSSLFAGDPAPVRVIMIIKLIQIEIA